jgi:NADH-quinone oxidoreductase subunit J
MENILFGLSSFATIFGALSVVFVKDIMHACVFLLLSFLGVSGLYLSLGADFVGVTQLVVYAGGVVILMIFAVMLTGGGKIQKLNKLGVLKTPMMGSLQTYIVGLFSASIFSLFIFRILQNTFVDQRSSQLPALSPTVEKIGVLLVTDHVLAFEISSVLLLGALVGATTIARQRRTNK